VEGNLLAAHQEIQKLGLLHPVRQGDASVTGELSWAQVEAAVLNVARYDVFKLSEAVLGGQVLRVQRMLDGLEAEGEAPVLVHWALAEDIRALKRVKDAMNAGKPLPMALRENRVWGVKERLYERILPRANDAQLARLLQAAHQVDGIVKGLKVPARRRAAGLAEPMVDRLLKLTPQGARDLKPPRAASSWPPCPT
jgi:DNA polymerase-3 subunit delta